MTDSSYRTHRRRGEVTPKGGPFLGLAVLVIIVAVFIGGSAFAGQKLYDSHLGKNQRVAGAPATETAPASASGDVTAPSPSPFAMSLGATAAPNPASVVVPAGGRPASVVASGTARLGRKVQPRRAAGAPPSTALPSERGAVGPAAVVAPNPF